MFDAEDGAGDEYKTMIEAAALGIKAGLENGQLVLEATDQLNSETIGDIGRALGDEVQIEEVQIPYVERGDRLNLIVEHRYRPPSKEKKVELVADFDIKPRGNIKFGSIPVGKQEEIKIMGFRFTKKEKKE